MTFNVDWRINNPGKTVVLPGTETLLDYIAEKFIKLGCSIQKKKDFFSVVLGGGRTPVMLNTRLVAMAGRLDWSRLIIFFSDDRCVPPNHPDSNFRMIHNTLVKPLHIPSSNVFRIKGEHDLENAATQYEQTLYKIFEKDKIPCFDLALLGLGPDGHTASLFPQKKHVLNEKNRLVIPAGKGPEGHERITLTYPIINQTLNIWFMISGKEKKEVFHNIINGKYNPLECPAIGVRPVDGELVYMVDQSVL